MVVVELRSTDSDLHLGMIALRPAMAMVVVAFYLAEPPRSPDSDLHMPLTVLLPVVMLQPTYLLGVATFCRVGRNIPVRRIGNPMGRCFAILQVGFRVPVGLDFRLRVLQSFGLGFRVSRFCGLVFRI